MARYLRQNTARTITVGPFFDVTDGITPEVSLTVTGCHLTMVVDNEGTPTLALDADATASSGNNDMVHVTNDDAGYYTLELTQANTNYVGGATLTIIDTDVHLPVFHEFTILPANVYDSLIVGTDLLLTDVSQISGDSTAADNCELMFDGTGYAGGSALLSVNVAAISGDTTSADNLESYTDGTTPIPANATQISGDATAADNLEAACDGTTYNIGGGAVVAASVTAMVSANVTQISGDSGAADNLEAACDGNTYNVGGGAIVAASVSGAVGSVTGAVASVTAMGVGGASLNAIPWNAAWDAEVQSEVQDAIEANNLDHIAGTATAIPAVVSGTYLDQIMDDGTETYDRTTDSLQALRDGAATVAAVADQVWNEARADHTTAGSFGEGVASVQGAVASVTGLTASDVGAIKTKTDYLPSATAGAAGGVFIAGANAATSITTALTANITGDLSGSVGSVTGAVGSVTGNVGGNVTGSVGSVTGAVGSVTGNVGGNVTGSVGSVAAGGITAASIATGAIDADALAADAVDEILDEVVEGTTTFRQALRLMLATLAGKCSGAGTATVTFRDIADTLDRVVATVDSSGNRTAITRTLT